MPRAPSPRRSSPRLLAALLVAVAPGCAPSLPGTPVAAEGLCDALAAVVCDADRACFPGATPDDCEATQASRCEATVGPLVRDPRLGYDPAHAGAFLADLDARAAGCWESPPSLDAFDAIFAGTGGSGAECTPPSLDLPGLRVAARSCAAGLACRLTLRADATPIGTCAPRDDEACSHALDCAPGRFCSLPPGWVPGLWGECRPLRVDGWACASDRECASGRCDEVCGPVPAGERPLRIDLPTRVRLDGPLVYLRHEAGSTRLTDASGNARAVQVVGTVGHVDMGVHPSDEGGALSLDGDASYVRVDELPLDGASAFSIELWTQRPEVGSAVPLASLVDRSGAPVRLGTTDRGDTLGAACALADPMSMGSPLSLASPEGALEADRWQHVVLAVDADRARLYVDGGMVAEGPVEEALALGRSLHLGHAPAVDGAPERFYAGLLDEVAVYDRALDAGRVRAHHQVGVAGAIANEFALFRWLEAR